MARASWPEFGPSEKSLPAPGRARGSECTIAESGEEADGDGEERETRLSALGRPYPSRDQIGASEEGVVIPDVTPPTISLIRLPSILKRVPRPIGQELGLQLKTVETPIRNP